jgi:hypothetical protein
MGLTRTSQVLGTASAHPKCSANLHIRMLSHTLSLPPPRRPGLRAGASVPTARFPDLKVPVASDITSCGSP